MEPIDSPKYQHCDLGLAADRAVIGVVTSVGNAIMHRFPRISPDTVEQVNCYLRSLRVTQGDHPGDLRIDAYDDAARVMLEAFRYELTEAEAEGRARGQREAAQRSETTSKEATKQLEALERQVHLLEKQREAALTALDELFRFTAALPLQDHGVAVQREREQVIHNALSVLRPPAPASDLLKHATAAFAASYEHAYEAAAARQASQQQLATLILGKDLAVKLDACRALERHAADKRAHNWVAAELLLGVRYTGDLEAFRVACAAQLCKVATYDERYCYMAILCADDDITLVVNALDYASRQPHVTLPEAIELLRLRPGAETTR